MGDLVVQRLHLVSAFDRLEEEPVELLMSPKDYEVHFAPTEFSADSTFYTQEGVTVTHPERSVERIRFGYLAGNISNRPDGAGHPRLVAGTSLAGFTEADDSMGVSGGNFQRPERSLQERREEPEALMRSEWQFGIARFKQRPSDGSLTFPGALFTKIRMITNTYMKLLTLFVLFTLSLTAGCTGGGSAPPPIPTPTLEPIPQPFRTQTTFVEGVLSVDVPYHDGRTRTLDSDRHRDRSWGLYLPRPLQPGHISRESILSENHYDGRIVLYAVVDWNDADPSDYLAAGWWLVYPPGVSRREIEDATRGVFIDGPELDPARPPDLPLTGTATYVGGAGGLYTYNYGRDWGELAGSSDITEFTGIIAFIADFGNRSLRGCLGCLEPIDIDPGRHLYPYVSWRTPDPAASPADYDIYFSASFDSKGAFEGNGIAVEHPERKITQAAGTWRGQFSNVPDPDGNPRRLVGSSDVHFAEEDGSSGNFTGIFDALTPATLKPADDGNGGNSN